MAACKVVPALRLKQCKACPWKLSTNPHTDIPGGYDSAKHAKLINCTGGLEALGKPIRAMACHESPPGREQACVGWVANQLGPGNNIALRMQAMDGRFAGLETDGEQYNSLREMCAAADEF